MALIREAVALQKVKEGAVVLDLGDLAARANQLRAMAAEQANNIMNDARARAHALVLSGRAEGIEQGLPEGRATGFAAGFEQGQASSLETATARFAELERAWSAALEGFVAQRELIVLEAREAVVRLAIEIAQRVVHQVIQYDPMVVARQLEEVLELVLRPSSLSVRLHPDDLAVVERVLPTMQARFAKVSHVRVETDPSLSAGSCIVTSDNGAIVDASVAGQLDRIVRALLPDERASLSLPTNLQHGPLPSPARPLGTEADVAVKSDPCPAEATRSDAVFTQGSANITRQSSNSGAML